MMREEHKKIVQQRYAEFPDLSVEPPPTHITSSDGSVLSVEYRRPTAKEENPPLFMLDQFDANENHIRATKDFKAALVPLATYGLPVVRRKINAGDTHFITDVNGHFQCVAEDGEGQCVVVPPKQTFLQTAVKIGTMLLAMKVRRPEQLDGPEPVTLTL